MSGHCILVEVAKIFCLALLAGLRHRAGDLMLIKRSPPAYRGEALVDPRSRISHSGKAACEADYPYIGEDVCGRTSSGQILHIRKGGKYPPGTSCHPP